MITRFFRFYFPLLRKSNTASVAKERLQIIVSHESARKTGPDIVKQLQLELIEVISKYIKVDQDLIKVQLERNGDHSVLELNVTLPEGNTLMKVSAETKEDEKEEAEKTTVEEVA